MPHDPVPGEGIIRGDTGGRQKLSFDLTFLPFTINSLMHTYLKINISWLIRQVESVQYDVN